MNKNIFQPADVLLYHGKDKTAFSVVACDQYTSEPEYWARVEERAGEKPSALRLIFPEAYLKTADFDQTIASINSSMDEYLRQGLFDEETDALIYVERKLKNGSVRKGLIGKIDLEEYDFTVGSQSAVRATEGTVLDRIPPRVKIRENAPLELPHVMLLIDDREKAVIEPLAEKKAALREVYSFPLMEDSGSLTGYALPREEISRVLSELQQLSEQEAFDAKYGVSDKPVLTYAVGDGNHSLATARQCYLNLKEQIGEEKALQHPARYALCELVNLHDASLEFEAVHRIIVNTDPARLLEALRERYRLSSSPLAGSQEIGIVQNGKSETWYIENPSRNLPVGSLQVFLDGYLAEHPGEIDYIHGDDVVKALSRQENSIGFLLPPMDKNDLFKTVILDGALPRKTFSMGEACDKRFYFEARKIR